MVHSGAPPVRTLPSKNVGNLSHIKSRGTDWPIGCRESESKSGISSGCPMRKGGPEASLVDPKYQGGTHTPGPVGRVIPCQGFASLNGRPKVHTACRTPLLDVNSHHWQFRLIGGIPPVLRHRKQTAKNIKRKY
jgi:hypothetical protein